MGARSDRQSHPQLRVLALATLLALITLAILKDRVHVPDTRHEIIWLTALVGLFTATEGFVIFVRVRRGAHAVSLADVPMILGLLAVNPFLVVVARLAGSLAGLFLVRGQRGPKLVFNVALVGLQAAVAALTFTALGGGQGPPTLREWLAAYAAALLADVVAVVAVTAVIAVHDDPQEWRRLPAAMSSVPFAAIATTVALVSVHAAAGNPWVLVLLAMLLVAVHLAYRAFIQQRQVHDEAQQLYGFTKALDGAIDLAQMLPVVLDRVRVQLRTDRAELVVSDVSGVLLHQVEGDHVMRTVRLDDAPADEPVRRVLDAAAVPVRTAGQLVVPVAIGDATAALSVADSLPDAGPFTPARLQLLEALAAHAGVALTKAALLEQVRREAAEKEHLALHDALTGLPNRHHFHQLVEAAAAGPGPVTVLVLDLERFAEINDALGYEAGDALLVELAGRLRDHLAGWGRLARTGGDEFAVVLPGCSADAAVAVAGELAALVGRPIVRGPVTLHVRVSMGVAPAGPDGTEALTLVRHADVAMYSAKRARTTVRVYEPAMDSDTQQRLSRIADLRRTLDENSLAVAFQPKVDLRTMRVVGAEALARWIHPEHGFVPPDVFIPLAEQSGLIRPLTLQVLETALRNRAAWAAGGHPIEMAVNLSASSLSDSTLPDSVGRLLAATGTDPRTVTLEITESTLMSDEAVALANLERLRALGVTLSIDDFGTGYSSLSRLRDLPIGEIKIDKSFVDGLATDGRNRALVVSTVQMGHALNLKVVAEGIEDEETLRYLRDVSCDVAQGYHLSRPLAAEAFTAWLHEYQPVPVRS